MEKQTKDFLSNFGKSGQRDDGGGSVDPSPTDSSTQLVLSSTSQISVEKQQTKDFLSSFGKSGQRDDGGGYSTYSPDYSTQLFLSSSSKQPVRRFASVRRGGGGGGGGGGTCPVCKVTFKKEDKQHFRNVYEETRFQLRLCNKCYFRHPATAKKIAEKKAKKKAEEVAAAAAAAEKKARDEAAAEAAEKN